MDISKIIAEQNKIQSRRLKSGGTKVKFWRPNAGENVIRVMPPWTEEGESAGSIFRPIAQHWGVTPRGPIMCPKHTADLEDSECPVCDLVESLRAQKSDVRAQETAKDIRVKYAWLFNIQDLSDPVYTAQDVAESKAARPEGDVGFEVGDPKIQVYAAGVRVFGMICDIITTNDLDITDVNKGYDITIKKTGSGFNTEYTVQPKLKASKAKISKDTAIPDLTTVGFVSSVDEMVAALAANDDLAIFADSRPVSRSLSSGVDDLEREMLAQSV